MRAWTTWWGLVDRSNPHCGSTRAWGSIQRCPRGDRDVHMRVVPSPPRPPAPLTSSSPSNDRSIEIGLPTSPATHHMRPPARGAGLPSLPRPPCARVCVIDGGRTCAMRSRMQAAVKAAEANLFRSPTRIKFKNILFIRFFLRNIRDINFIVDLA